MTGNRRSSCTAILPMLWATAAAAQPGFDCTKATTAAEKAICADPRLAGADAAMTKAFAALLRARLPVQQAALRNDQKRWVTERDAGCFDKKDDALARCLLAATRARQHFLAGEGENGAAGAPALLPVYFLELRKGAYDITIAYPQFAAPAAPKFNAAVHTLVFGNDALSEYRQDKPNPNSGAGNFYQVGYETTYLDPHLASVTLQFADFAGGAHPNNARSAVLWNPAADAPVALADFLADPSRAVPAVAALCKAQAEKDDWGLFDNPDFDAVVKDAKSWAVDTDGVTVMFDPYSVTPYVAGPHDCRLSYADLKDWLKPGGVLPPK